MFVFEVYATEPGGYNGRQVRLFREEEDAKEWARVASEEEFAWMEYEVNKLPVH